jgi:hypothetical protein
MRLTSEQLRTRYAHDFDVVSELNGPVIAVAAFESSRDLQHGRSPIVSSDRAHLARRYRIDYHVPTLIGPGRWQSTTSIGFDLSVDNYPFHEPANWVISRHVPFSPHFREGAPVCTGELWEQGRGHLLLAHLVLHVARLLNWDEVARGGGYRGWNGEAIRYHREHFGTRPLNPDLRLPTPPPHLTHEGPSEHLLFSPGRPAGPRPGEDALFGPAGRP